MKTILIAAIVFVAVIIAAYKSTPPAGRQYGNGNPELANGGGFRAYENADPTVITK